MDEKTFMAFMAGIAAFMGLLICMVVFLASNITQWITVEERPEVVEVTAIHTSKHSSYATIRTQGSRQEHRQSLGGSYAGRRYASLSLPVFVPATATKYQRQYFGTTETTWSYPDLQDRLNEALARP